MLHEAMDGHPDLRSVLERYFLQVWHVFIIPGYITMTDCNTVRCHFWTHSPDVCLFYAASLRPICLFRPRPPPTPATGAPRQTLPAALPLSGQAERQDLFSITWFSVNCWHNRKLVHQLKKLSESTSEARAALQTVPAGWFLTCSSLCVLSGLKVSCILSQQQPQGLLASLACAEDCGRWPGSERDSLPAHHLQTLQHCEQQQQQKAEELIECDLYFLPPQQTANRLRVIYN